VRIRSKVFFFSLLFAAASSAVMAWCFINIRREEAAFVNSRRAMKTFAAVTDIEYFFVRQVRLLESYVLLGEESERLQLVQATAQARQRLEEWEEAVNQGKAHGVEVPAVQAVAEAIGVPANKIRSLIAQGKRTQAMEQVEKEFSPASARALKKFNAVKMRVEDTKNETELLVVQEFQRSHLGLMAGLGLVVMFGLGFLWALYSAVIRPIQKMRAWADGVARGEKGLAMTAFSGQNELTELAQSLGEMAIQLTRPKAYPPSLPEAKVPPVSRPPSAIPSTPAISPQPVVSVAVPPNASAQSVVKPPTVTPVDKVLPAPQPPTPPSPPVAPPKDDFEDAVTEFREILTQMARKESPKKR
jgi:HAMP domain-containing protein